MSVLDKFGNKLKTFCNFPKIVWFIRQFLFDKLYLSSWQFLFVFDVILVKIDNFE